MTAEFSPEDWIRNGNKRNGDRTNIRRGTPFGIGQLPVVDSADRLFLGFPGDAIHGGLNDYTDEETAVKLDDWVKTGAVKSRSEAAAVFIKIGLNVNDESLRSVADALREVEAAKQKVAERMKEVFGESGSNREQD
jgi:hypothetical protein